MMYALSYALIGLVAVAQASCSVAAKTPAKENSVARSPAKIAAMSIERLDPALDAVIARGTQIEKMATGFTFAEGPIWYKGRLLFADLPASRIIEMTADGKHHTLVEQSGGPTEASTSAFNGSNGMVADASGNILATQHAGRRIVRFDSKWKIANYIDRYEGKRLNSPNDLVFARDGSLWFTDPPFGLRDQAKDAANEIPFSGVYRYANGKLTAVIKDLPLPNGLAFSPDGKTLYVNNSGPLMALWRYDVAPDGTVSNGRTIISYPGTADDVPDGMKVDTAGNIWAAGPGGIRIITPQGKVLGQIKLPEVAANLAWADGGKTLYIMASTSVYRLKVVGRGAMPMYAFP